jgi:hypothetical protein
VNVQFQPLSVGSIIAVVVLILCIVLLVIGHMPLLYAGLIGALALSRLL